MQQSAELLPCARGAHLVHGGHDLVGCDMTRGRRLQTEFPRTGLREEARVGCWSAMRGLRAAAPIIMRNRSRCRSVWDLLMIRLENGDVSNQSIGCDCQRTLFQDNSASLCKNNATIRELPSFAGRSAGASGPHWSRRPRGRDFCSACCPEALRAPESSLEPSSSRAGLLQRMLP